MKYSLNCIVGNRAKTLEDVIAHLVYGICHSRSHNNRVSITLENGKQFSGNTVYLRSRCQFTILIDGSPFCDIATPSTVEEIAAYIFSHA